MPPKRELPLADLAVHFAVLRFIARRQQPPPIPPEPLEAFRVAATCLPPDARRVGAARAELREALRAAYPHDAAEVGELFAAGAAAEGQQREAGRPSFMMNDVYAMQSMQEIVPGLFLGSYHPATNRELLASHNVTHVLCCIGVTPRFPAELVYLTLPADDSPAYDISIFFAKTFDFIENAIIKKHSGVLVHCGAGISRAPTVAAAYLIRKMRMKASDAIALLKSRRGVVSPNKGFRQQLLAYQKQLGI